MVFYVSGTSVQLPVRAESMAASAAYGFRPSVVDGRGAFSVRRAAGERVVWVRGVCETVFYVSGTSVQLSVWTESAAGSTVCGFRPSLVDGRGAFVVRRAAGKGIAAVESPGTRRARVVCEVVRCIRPIARAGSEACGFRPFSMDGREAFP